MSPASRRVLVVNQSVNAIRVRVYKEGESLHVREMPIPPNSHETVLLWPHQYIVVDDQP